MAALNPIEQVIEPRPRDIDGLAVERVLRPPLAMDVRPHPHIGLATLTYLLEGEIFHRDSLGSARAIRPGAINWMVAGRGVVHSERTPAELRSSSPRLHGLQLWVALPRDHEEAAPSFRHHPAGSLPTLHEGHAEIRLVIGQAKLVARGATLVALLGGEPLGEQRHAWWNFVSSSRERIEQAKADWAAGRFPKVSGDELEFVPLPGRARVHVERGEGGRT